MGRFSGDGRRSWLVVMIGLLFVLAAVGSYFAYKHAADPAPPRQAFPAALPAAPASYIGLYERGVPGSYAGVTSFTRETGVRPQIVTYYSGWFQPFSTSFAKAAEAHGAVPLVQINPAGVSVTAIASGRYDGYLITYAEAVRAHRLPVILSFGHEMNGSWYSWGYHHTPPKVFVAAWQHIVNVFRTVGARNVTWLWTINAFAATDNTIPSPAAWWPGRSYVTWVGLDGYYRQQSDQFVTMFGPTITVVRELTTKPILIAETAAAQAVGQPGKIADLFAGVKKYELLGFVWFDNNAERNYAMTRAAQAAMRLGGTAYREPVP